MRGVSCPVIYSVPGRGIIMLPNFDRNVAKRPSYCWCKYLYCSNRLHVLTRRQTINFSTGQKVTPNVFNMAFWKQDNILVKVLMQKKSLNAPLINAIVNNALLHSNSRIKQMPPQIIHILRFL